MASRPIGVLGLCLRSANELTIHSSTATAEVVNLPFISSSPVCVAQKGFTLNKEWNNEISLSRFVIVRLLYCTALINKTCVNTTYTIPYACPLHSPGSSPRRGIPSLSFSRHHTRSLHNVPKNKPGLVLLEVTGTAKTRR